jgi:hypothetical protein
MKKSPEYIIALDTCVWLNLIWDKKGFDSQLRMLPSKR